MSNDPPWARVLQLLRDEPGLTHLQAADRLDLAHDTVARHLWLARVAGEEIPYVRGKRPRPISPGRIAALLTPKQRNLLLAVSEGVVVDRLVLGERYAVRLDLPVSDDRTRRYGGIRATKTVQGLAHLRLVTLDGAAQAANGDRLWRLTERGHRVLSAAMLDEKEPS